MLLCNLLDDLLNDEWQEVIIDRNQLYVRQ